MKNSDHGFFEMVKAQYAKQIAESGNKYAMPILTQSSLRLEQFVSASLTSYTFPVLQGDVGQGSQSVLATEVRLQQNDNFHIHKVGFYLAVTTASTDTAFRLLTQPSDISFVTVAAALNYMNIYNGLMNISVNQVNVLTNYRLSKHLFVPQTQRLTATVNNNYDQVDMSTDGLIELNPSIMLSGAYTNQITVQLPAAVTSALASSNSRMVIIYEGLRAQNAAIRK